MARKTDGEKIDELEKLVAKLNERLDNAAKELSRLLDLPTRIALLEHRVANLEKNQERWGQRIWMVLAPLIAAVVASLLTYLLKP